VKRLNLIAFAQVDGPGWFFTGLLGGASCYRRTRSRIICRCAFHQHLASAIILNVDRLITRGAFLLRSAWSTLASGFAAFAFIVVDNHIMTLGALGLDDLRARLLLTLPGLATSVGLFDELVTG